MKKASLVVLALALVAGLAAQETADKAKKASKKDMTIQWTGRIVNQNEEKMTMDITRHNIPRTVMYNESTQWMENGKPTDRSNFKDGSRVTVVATEKDGQFIANKIELRKTTKR